MMVCEKCARGKEVTRSFGNGDERRQARRIVSTRAEPETDELVENFGEVIRKAREAIGLSLAVLAERISEKESTLVRVEKEKTLPSEKTRSKLEKELGIRLATKTTETKSSLAIRKNEPTTLWDLAQKGKGKKGE